MKNYLFAVFFLFTTAVAYADYTVKETCHDEPDIVVTKSGAHVIATVTVCSSSVNDWQGSSTY